METGKAEGKDGGFEERKRTSRRRLGHTTGRMSKLASRSAAGASSEPLTIALLGSAQTCRSEVYL